MDTQNALLQPRRRFKRKLLIMPKFQLLVIGINLCVILTMSAIIWAGTRSALLDLKPVAGLSGIEASFYKHYLDYQIASFQESLLISLVVGAVASTLLTLVITHRISGPMIRMRNYFRNIKEGGPANHIEFRDGDYFRELPPLINGAIDRLGEKQGTNKKSA